MIGTPTVVDRVVERLTTDSDLTALLTGGIYTRELKREGNGATPDAFSSTPPYQPRPAAVIRDNGDVTDLLGPGGAQSSYITIWVLAQAHQSGRDAIAAAIELIKGRLIGWSFPNANGAGATVENVSGRIGIHDDPVVPNRIQDAITVQIIGIWRALG